MLKEGYKRCEIGVIPEDWEVKSIGDLFEFKNGLNKEKEYFGKGTKIINYVDVFRNRYLDNSIINGLVEVTEKEKQLFNTKKGDVFFTRTSETIEEIGMTSVLIEDIPNLVYSGFILRARPKSDELSLLYKKYCFSDFCTRKEITRKSSCTTRALTSGTLLKDVLIKVPPLKEQERIAEILSTVDCQIDDTKMLIEKCRVLKKGLMQRLLSRGIGHCEFKSSEVGEIPVSWEVLGFFDFVERIIDFRGRTPKKLGLDWGGGDILALSANNVKMGNIDFTIENYFASNELYEKWMLGSELCKNDILMTMEAPLGNVALVPDNKKYILSQRVVALKTKEFINNEFMLYMIMSDIIQNQLNMLSTGTTAKGINQKNLAKVKVVIPTLEEQEKIAQILLSVDSEIEEYENKMQQLEELKKGLMQQLLSGKIRTV